MSTTDSLSATWIPRQMSTWCAREGPLQHAGPLGDLWANPPNGGTLITCDSAGRQTACSPASAATDSERYARVLASLEVGRGDVVAWRAANTALSVFMMRACWQIGAIAAPIHHLAGKAEMASISELAAPDHIFASAESLSGVETAQDPGDEERHTEHHDIDPASIALVLHTSGSSGVPKAVLHTHRALSYKARLMVDIHGLTPHDAVLMPAPLAHISGLLNGVLLPAAGGFKTVLMEKWSPELALGLIEEHSISFMVGPTTFFTALESAPGFSSRRVDSMRIISAGGSGVTPEFVDRISVKFGAEVKRSYGSTEAPTITTSDHGSSLEARSTTDGRPVGNSEIVLHPDTGELLVTGPEMFAGYVDSEETAAATSTYEGRDWFHTGDLGEIGSGGSLRITGRIKDTIIRAGENIAAAEIESALTEHPDVAAAAAIGISHDVKGEIVCAIVQLVQGVPSSAFGLKECSTLFSELGIPKYRTPERLEILGSLPLLASGKVDKAALLAQFG